MYMCIVHVGAGGHATASQVVPRSNTESTDCLDSDKTKGGGAGKALRKGLDPPPPTVGGQEVKEFERSKQAHWRYAQMITSHWGAGAPVPFSHGRAVDAALMQATCMHTHYP